MIYVLTHTRIYTLHTVMYMYIYSHVGIYSHGTPTHQKGVPTKEFAGDLSEADPKSAGNGEIHHMA